VRPGRELCHNCCLCLYANIVAACASMQALLLLVPLCKHCCCLCLYASIVAACASMQALLLLVLLCQALLLLESQYQLLLPFVNITRSGYTPGTLYCSTFTWATTWFTKALVGSTIATRPSLLAFSTQAMT